MKSLFDGQAHPEAVNPATGPKVPWTSGLTGTVNSMEDDPKQVSHQCHAGLTRSLSTSSPKLLY
jgi:hypothetical protein